MKEADLYGYVFDARKPPGGQDPFAQRIGAEKMGRRELRQRRNRDMLDSAAQSEEEGEGEGRATGRRQRRATRRFDAIVSEQPSGANTPKKNNGWGGARKRGVSKFAKETSETPEPDGRPAKRPKILGAGPLHPRIQEMREESAVPSSSEEAATPDTIETQEPEEQQPRPGPAEEGRKRGRPAGSKNTGRRSDYGIKKGPRKKPAEVPVVPVPAATMPSANAPPPVLQSLSEGQNQFSIDPQAQVSNPQHHVLAPAVPPPPPPPPMAPQPVATVFQATPQPLGMLDTQPRPSQPGEPHPDQYISTTPLSHYTHPYTDSAATSPTSGSKRKPRVKSEKRSQSMTIWWAERKAKQKELEALNGPATAGSPTDGSAAGGSKSSTPKPTSRRGGRGGSSRAEQSPRLHPDPNTREAYPTPPPPPPSTHAHPGHMEYMQQAPQHPPPGQMLMQHSPLAAMPSGPPQPMPPVPPQLQQFQGPPQPMSTRPSMPVLAPAPMPPQLQSYPSPYGPRSAPRPKSSGPPPLAPAPPTTHTHISPYPPAHGHGPHGPHGHGHGHGPILQREMMEMPFKVLVPGPPPPPPQGEERRG